MGEDKLANGFLFPLKLFYFQFGASATEFDLQFCAECEFDDIQWTQDTSGEIRDPRGRWSIGIDFGGK